MARLVGYFLLLSILTVGLVGLVVYWRATEDLKQSMFNRLQGVATLKEDSLIRWVDEQRRNIVFIAWLPGVRSGAGRLLRGNLNDSLYEATYTSLSEYLSFVISSLSDSEEIFILDLDGLVVLSTNKDHEGESRGDATYFVRGMTNTFVQPFYTSPTSGKPAITVATPLFDEDRRRIGVLASHLNLARIDRIILERSGLGESGETYLVNTLNEFVSASMPGKQDLFAGEVHSQGIDAALNGQDGQGLYKNYRGTPVIGVYRWLEDQDVVLAAEMSQEEAFSDADRLAVSILLIGAVSSLLLATGLALLARQIVRPIQAITQTATQVAAGDLTKSVAIQSEDEVGTLSRAFNQMTEQLRTLYHGLEMKVAERTSDLTQANIRLQREIAERKRIEEELRQYNEYLAALHETALGMISRLDLNELLSTLIVRAEQLLGTPHGDIYLVNHEENVLERKLGTGIFKNDIGVRMQSGEGLSGKVWRSGETLTVENYAEWEGRSPQYENSVIRAAIGVPLISSNQVIGVLGLTHTQDTERTFTPAETEILYRFAQLASIAIDNARLFSDAQKARSEAEAANESKSTFLANVSHELRTPLTSILGFARIVQKRLEERIFPSFEIQEPRVAKAVTQVRDNLQIILDESHRLTTMINNVLDLSKIEAGKMDWKTEIVNMNQVMEMTVHATASLFEGKPLHLVLEIEPDLPGVRGDRDKLIQVMINLISNAVKFTRKGKVTLSAHTDGDHVEISVVDTGIGIADEDMPIIFEKFKQVGDTLTDKPRGTGLGLPISKEIVEHHGGQIWAKSKPGYGSTFSFSLPVKETKAQTQGQLSEG
jgi:signal transduction histidine kinase/HAMP domain-containing protein